VRDARGWLGHPPHGIRDRAVLLWRRVAPAIEPEVGGANCRAAVAGSAKPSVRFDELTQEFASIDLVRLRRSYGTFDQRDVIT
jgi:hypothetical protein